MSECTLYVLDAPRIQTPEGAARQVEKSQQEGASAEATPRLQSLFDALLSAFPDGGPGSIWYEGFEHNAPKGSTLALVFRQAIRMDRPPPFPEPGERGCPSGLRFDGVYELKMPEGYDYFCFTRDGRVLSQSMTGRVGPRRVLQLMYECDAFVARGPYKPGSRSFTGRMSAAYGSFKLSGELSDRRASKPSSDAAATGTAAYPACGWPGARPGINGSAGIRIHISR